MTNLFICNRNARGLLATILGFALLLSFCGETKNDSDQKPTTIGAEIIWDEWGVPHIYANTTLDADYAFGRAQMTNHTNLLLKLYGKSRGRGAEYWGTEYLYNDKYMHRMGVPERAARLLEAQGPEYAARISAFVQGMNDWATENPDAVNDTNQQVLPIRPTDVLAQIQNSIHTTFLPMNNADLVGRWKRQDKKQKEVPGSNAWAIGPSRSKSGNSMLLMNPHLPWRDLFLFFEAHINVPTNDGGRYNAYGIGLIGMPFMAVVFNENLGWSHTVASSDGADTYELKLVDGGDGGYMMDGEVRAFEERSVILKIRSDDGTMSSETLLVRNSIHGPVVAEQDDKALVWKIAGLTEPKNNRLFEQYWKMGSAANLDEFESALSMQQIPIFNTVYADRHGDIFYAFSVLQPIRSQGDVNFWKGIIDGTRSCLNWSEYRAYKELPKYRNPPSGFIQNANDPPWTSTFPQVLKAADFPPDTAPQSMLFRPQSSASMLLADKTISWDELLEYRKSTRSSLADRILGDLISSARDSGDESAIEGAKVLAAWDRQTLPDSRGAVLFLKWTQEVGLRRVYNNDFFVEKWSPDNPLSTPRGLADPDAAVTALATVTKLLKTTYGAVDVSWGEVVRVRYAGQDHPSSVGAGPLGTFRAGFIRSQDKDGKITVRGGNTFVAAIEFGERVRARGILGPGNATEESTGHFGDQLGLHATAEFRDILYYREDVEAGAVRREVLPVYVVK